MLAPQLEHFVCCVCKLRMRINALYSNAHLNDALYSNALYSDASLNSDVFYSNNSP